MQLICAYMRAKRESASNRVKKQINCCSEAESESCSKPNLCFISVNRLLLKIYARNTY